MRPVAPCRFAVVGAGFLARLEPGAGSCLLVVRGAVWVTQEGDGRDHVVAAGEILRFERPGVVLITALGGEAALGYDAAASLRFVRLRASPTTVPAGSPGADLGRILPLVPARTLARAAPDTRRTAAEAQARSMRSCAVAAVSRHAGRLAHRAWNGVLRMLAHGVRTACAFVAGRRLLRRRLRTP